eukprot:8554469-Pyramimonas_sp.AAC.1
MSMTGSCCADSCVGFNIEGSWASDEPNRSISADFGHRRRSTLNARAGIVTSSPHRPRANLHQDVQREEEEGC